MKATISKHIGASRAQWYTAEYGCLSVSNTSAATARADLDANVRLALERLHKGAQIIQLGGLTVVISPNLYGWEYRIAAPERGCFNLTASYDDAVAGAWTLIGQQAFDAGLDDTAILAQMPVYPQMQMRHWLRLQREATT